MRPFSITRVAWQGVRGYAGRNILTAIALSLGLLAFVTVASASGALQSVIEQRELLLNGPRTTSTVSIKASAPAADVQLVRDRFTEFFASEADTSLVTVGSGAVVTAPDGTAIAETLIIDESLIEIRPFIVLAGTWLGPKGQLAPRIVLNSAAVATLGAQSGDWAIVLPDGANVRAVVIGVVEDAEDWPAAYVSSRDLTNWGVSESRGTTALLVSGSTVTTTDVKALDNAYDSLLGETHIHAIERTDTVDRVADEIRTTRSVFSIVIAFSLLGTVVAIANVGFSSVRERAHELALRRALGSTRRTVFLVVLVESQIVAAASWVVATAVSVILYPVVATNFGVPIGIQLPAFPIDAAATGLLLGSLSALLGAVAPAVAAARMNLSSVMRA